MKRNLEIQHKAICENDEPGDMPCYISPAHIFSLLSKKPMNGEASVGDISGITDAQFQTSSLRKKLSVESGKSKSF